MIDKKVTFSGVKFLRNPKFRKGFCLKPGFRYAALRPYCNEIVFATDGYKTNIREISDQLVEAFKDFDPEEDCIVPTGTSITNILVGYLLSIKYPDQAITVAFFLRETSSDNNVMLPEDYKFYQLQPRLLLE